MIPAALLATAIGTAVASGASAGPIGGEPPDFDFGAGYPTFTASVGTNTVSGTIGPSPDDIQDQFSVVIPPHIELTSVSYSGPSDFPHNILGCGLTGSQQLNVTFDPVQSGCTLSWVINRNFATASAPWTVTINTRAGQGTADTTPPVLQLPADMTVEAGNATGAIVNYSVTASDDIDPNPTVACTPAAGQFPDGTTTVSCTATDNSNNSASGSFTVTVHDTTPPVLDVPDDVTVEASGPTTQISYPAATATDIGDDDGVVAVACTPASPFDAPVGVHEVSCTATDDSANTASASFTVTVRDTTSPVIDVPDDFTVEATGPVIDVVYPVATATDIADDDVTVTCEPPSPLSVGVGDHEVSCTATDDSGNTSVGSFTVTVADTTGPQLALPGNMFVPATGPDGADVTYTVSATDLVDGDVDATCLPVSGSTFELGDTTVECTATDAADNTSTGSFIVTVQDETFPILELPSDITVEATGPGGATVSYSVTATDLTDPDVELMCAPASESTFPLGATTVACEATDDDDNVTTGTFTVTVTDTSAPVLRLPADIVAPARGPDGAIVEFDVTATDIVAGDVPVDCVPPSGSLFPVGTTTVTCTASDQGPVLLGSFGQVRPTQVTTGNVATGTFTVTVEPAQVAPTTSTPAASTTAGASTSVPSTTTPSSALPSTGGSPASLSLAAVAAIVAGCLLVAIAPLTRRR